MSPPPVLFKAMTFEAAPAPAPSQRAATRERVASCARRLLQNATRPGGRTRPGLVKKA